MSACCSRLHFPGQLSLVMSCSHTVDQYQWHRMSKNLKNKLLFDHIYASSLWLAGTKQSLSHVVQFNMSYGSASQRWEHCCVHFIFCWGGRCAHLNGRVESTQGGNWGDADAVWHGALGGPGLSHCLHPYTTSCTAQFSKKIFWSLRNKSTVMEALHPEMLCHKDMPFFVIELTN